MPKSCASRAGCSRSKATWKGGAELSRLARLGAAPAGEIVGAAHLDQLCAADARPGAGARGLRVARAGLRLVHRRLRHQGPAGSQGAAGRIGRAGTARARRGYARRTIRVAAEPRHGHRGLAARPRIGAIAPAFAQNDIGPDLLPSLTAEELKEIGIASLGHRRRLLEAIAALRPAPAADSRWVPDPSPRAGPRRNAGRSP